jgi:plasmid segregation protein ParM
MDYRAIDVGFGWVKALKENVRKKFAAVIGDFVPVKYSSGMNTDSPELQIAINHEEYGKYYIGEAAQTQSTAMATMEKDRIIKKEGELLLLSALGLLQQYKTEAIKLVVGLPVLYYNETRKLAYQSMANGEHQFQFLRSDGGILNYCNFAVEETKVLPQPMGTIFSQLINDKGDIIDENIASGKIGAIVIGYNTLEIARCDNLDYIESKSTSFPKLGMYSIYESLHNEIFRELEINIPIEEIEPYVLNNYIKIRGKNIDITYIKQNAYNAARDKIMSKIINLWDDIGLMDRIYIAGGVANVIGPSIRQILGDYSVVVKDPVWSVADGYGKYAKWLWRR